ncbi:MAG: hypothetical protein JNK49_09765 [Planctomycetes bacterium]|nr:hypothetical protein [Planctomycetota bacterium]
MPQLGPPLVAEGPIRATLDAPDRDLAARRERIEPAGTFLDIAGVVTTSSWTSKLDRAGLLLRLRWHGQASQSAAPDAEALCSASGEFRLRLDPRDWHLLELYQVHVTAQGGGSLFQGWVCLQSPMAIDLPAQVTYRGTLVGGDGEGVRAQVALHDFGPDGNGVRLAGGTTDRLGRFAFDGSVGVMDVVEVRADVQVAGLRMPFACLVSRSLLVSEAGATIAVDLRPVRLVVRSASAGLLEGAAVRGLNLLPGGVRRPRFTAFTGATGQVDLPLQSATMLVVSHPEHASTQLQIEAGTGRAEVTLQPVAWKNVTGSVVDGAGAPAPRAEIYAWPGHEELDFVEDRAVVAHLDSGGRFHLQVAADDRGRITIATEGLGIGASLRLEIPDQTGADVRIELPDSGEVVLDMAGDNPGNRATRAPPVVLLASAERQWRRQRDVFAGNLRMHLPTGGYRALGVFGELAGLAEFQVESEGTVVRVPLLPKREVELDLSGVGLVEGLTLEIWVDGVGSLRGLPGCTPRTVLDGRHLIVVPDVKGTSLALSKGSREERVELTGARQYAVTWQ